MNCEIKRLSIYIKINKLSLNIKNKTHTITFSNMKSIRERKNDIYIDDIKIDTVNNIKMLGLIINKTLNWSAHIKYICSKIY